MACSVNYSQVKLVGRLFRWSMVLCIAVCCHCGCLGRVRFFECELLRGLETQTAIALPGFTALSASASCMLKLCY